MVCLGFNLCSYQAYSILKEDEGDENVKSISIKIRKGANAYLTRQYKGVAIFFALMFIIFLVLSLFDFVSIFVPFSFVMEVFYQDLVGLLE